MLHGSQNKHTFLVIDMDLVMGFNFCLKQMPSPYDITMLQSQASLDAKTCPLRNDLNPNNETICWHKLKLIQVHTTTCQQRPKVLTRQNYNPIENTYIVDEV